MDQRCELDEDGLQVVAEGDARESSVACRFAVAVHVEEDEGLQVADGGLGASPGGFEARVRVGTRSRTDLSISGRWSDWAADGGYLDPRSTAAGAVLAWVSGILVGRDSWGRWWRREEGYGDALDRVVFFWAERGRAAGWSSGIFLLEAGVFDEGEPLLFDWVDEVDRLRLREAFAAFWPGEDLAPPHGRVRTPPCGKDNSDSRFQGTASGAVAAFMSADSAGVSACWGSAGVVVVAVVGRHVSFGCMNANIGRRSWIAWFVGLL